MVSQSHAGNDGGGIYNSGSLTVVDSLVEKNQTGSGRCSVQSILSTGWNVETPGDTCALFPSTDLVSVTDQQLKLGPMANHGGPTPTRSVGLGSVAVDRIMLTDCLDENGTPPLTDQRGVARPQGAMCDVGAFELEAP